MKQRDKERKHARRLAHQYACRARNKERGYSSSSKQAQAAAPTPPRRLRRRLLRAGRSQWGGRFHKKGESR